MNHIEIQFLKSLLTRNYEGVKSYLSNGGNPNVTLNYNTPVEIAIASGDLEIIKLLVEYRADIGDQLEEAVLTKDIEIVKFIINCGVNIEYTDIKGRNAYDMAYRKDGNLGIIKILEEKGLSVKLYAGRIFRRAASKGDMDTLEFLYDKGVDINYNEADGVYPYGSTPIIEAVRSNKLDVVKWMVERNCDLTIVDDYGKRPYICALKLDNPSIANYLRQFETDENLKIDTKLKEFKKYKLPKSLINILSSNERRIVLDEYSEIEFIELNHISECSVSMWFGRQCIDLLLEVDQYGEVGFLVWDIHNKKLATVDFESEEVRILDTWTKFQRDPSKVVLKIFA